MLEISQFSGTKRTEVSLKTDRFPGFMPDIITLQNIKVLNTPTTQRLHAGVHNSTGHTPGVYRAIYFS